MIPVGVMIAVLKLEALRLQQGEEEIAEQGNGGEPGNEVVHRRAPSTAYRRL